MSLEQRDLELIERLIYKNSDDIAISIARSFERLEERIDLIESRVYGCCTDAENSINSSKRDILTELDSIKCEIRDSLEDLMESF